MKTPTYEEIKPYIEKELVTERVHPEDENVRIFNYTQTCQFEGIWDDVTRQCRGLIMDVSTGRVLAKPFPKFFNYSEHVQKGWPLPKGTPVITEKLDGSLGIFYWLNGKPWIATRGSFTSDQAVWATEFYRNNYPIDDISSGGFFTHLFEIIYPENRIVVNYDYSGLVHLTSLDIESRALDIDLPGRNVKKVIGKSVEELAALDEKEGEGFVLYYPEEGVRMKIKFPEYVRLHKIITGISEIGIWEMLKDGSDFSQLIEKVPDEFFSWVTKTKNDLNDKYDYINNIVIDDFENLIVQFPLSRKEFAELAVKTNFPSIMFAKLDSKPYDQIIWKMVRPVGKSVFRTDIDL